jgi:hypothetical protein
MAAQKLTMGSSAENRSNEEMEKTGPPMARTANGRVYRKAEQLSKALPPGAG